MLASYLLNYSIAAKGNYKLESTNNFFREDYRVLLKSMLEWVKLTLNKYL